MNCATSNMLRKLGLMTLAIAVLFAVTGPGLCMADESVCYLRDFRSSTELTPANLPAAAHLLGTPYEKAIVGSSPKWRLDYMLNRKYVRFRALAGVGDRLGAQVAAIFTVLGDGQTLFKSNGAQYSGDPPVNLDLDIAGVKHLSLIVADDGADPFPKEVVWADPIVYSSDASIPDPPAWPPVVTNQNPSPAPVASTPAPNSEPKAKPAPSFGEAKGQYLAPPMSSGRTVLVVPFHRVFGEPWASNDIADEIRDQLASQLHMNVVPIEHVRQQLGEVSGYLSPDEVRQAAGAVGARYVVMGSIEKFQLPSGGEGGGIRVPFLGIGVRTMDADVKFDFEVEDASGHMLVSQKAEASKKQSSVSGGIFTPGAAVDVDSRPDIDKLMYKTIQAAVGNFISLVKPVLAPDHDSK